MNVAGPSAMPIGGLPSPGLDYDSAFCQGCRNPIDSDPLHGGVVVQFASSLWHTACFRCAKCDDQLSAQSTLVLLNDGSPVCSKCSYVCNVCKLEINDEAIMTGEDAYHASCFTCRTCHKRIEELVFAKTSQGIYCMDCHNDRVARSRRRAEHKQSKGRSRRARDGDQSRDATKSSPRPDSGHKISSQRSNGNLMGDRSYSDQSYSSHPPPSRSSSKQGVPQDVDASFVSELGELNDAVVHQVPIQDGIPPGSAVMLSPDDEEADFGPLHDEPESQYQNGARRQDTYPVPILPLAGETKKSKSYDDGTRPLQALFGAPVNGKTNSTNHRTSDASIMSIPLPGGGGLDIPGRATTKAERRRSINPPPRSEPVADGSVDIYNDTRGRSVSSASDRSAYYSSNPADPGRTSPSTPTLTQTHSQLDVDLASARSRSRSPSFSKPQPALPTAMDSAQTSSRTASAISEATVTSTPSNFPPRGQSLQNPRAADSGLTNASNAPSPSASRPKLTTPEPSFSFEPASDDEDGPPSRKKSAAGGAPLPPPKDDSPSRPSTPNPPSSVALPSLPSTPPPPSSATSASSVSASPRDEELTPVQTRRVAPSSTQPPQSSFELAPPALPPIRLSLHGADFADLLKSVADGSPRVPMPRESQLRLSLGSKLNGVTSAGSSTSGSDVDSPVMTKPSKQMQRAFGQRNSGGSGDVPSDVEEEEDESPRYTNPSSPSTLAQERIAASQTLPAFGGRSGDSSGEDMSFGLSPVSATTPTPAQAQSEHGGSVESPTSSTSAPTVNVSSIASLPGSSAPSASRNRSGSTPTANGDRSKPSTVTPASANGTLPRLNIEQRDSNVKLLPVPNGGTDGSLRPTMPQRTDSATELASRRLREALNDAHARGATSLKLDPQFAEALLRSIDSSKEMYSGLKTDLDNVKRTSHQYMKGFTVAQEEYQNEVAHRKDLEAEVSRLRVQLAGQAARLVAVTAQDRTQAALEKLAVETTTRLQGLERELARLKTDRDMALAEIEELNIIKKSTGGAGNEAIANVSRALSSRLDYTKIQYRRELEPLEEKRERLMNDIAELREARAIFVEETTALNTRNEQLAELNAQIALQVQAAAADGVSMGMTGLTQLARGQGQLSQDTPPQSAQSEGQGKAITSSTRARRAEHRDRGRNSPSLASSATINTLVGSQESSDEFGARMIKVSSKPETPEPIHPKKFKWFGPGGNKHMAPSPATEKPTLLVIDKHSNNHPEKTQTHNFASINILRIGRCDQCGEKLWGAGLRCTNCSFACHTRCGIQVKGACRHTGHEDSSAEMIPMPPSMFGRDLIEQVRSDDKGDGRMVPVIVEKCLEAVEAIGLDYEGIYRKTGGASESKAITQLFERGQYDRIDLLDGESFHDISSVTSVLKNYFRALPNPLFTFEYHESFVASATLKDPANRIAALQALVQSLPSEHGNTLRALMLHLHKVERQKDVNLMNARNLGVVFGPTLMRSRDPGQEFADMAGKATTVEWLVNHAPTVFGETLPSS